jgi:hypothetical protein
MSPESPPHGDNPAQIKGDINKGLTGDKRPGFDPAMSPLETDSEAGGVALSPEQVQVARETQRSALPQQTARNFDVAMTSAFPSTLRRRPSGTMVVTWVMAAVVLAAALLGLVMRLQME